MSATKTQIQALPWTCRRCGKTMPFRDQPAHLDWHGAALIPQPLDKRRATRQDGPL